MIGNGYKITIKILTLAGIALIPVWFLFISLMLIAAPTQASPQPEGVTLNSPKTNLPPARPLAQTSLAITKSASTDLDPVNGSRVSVGSSVNYEITIKNISASPVNLITITDQLPPNALTNIACQNSTPAALNCSVITRTIVFTSKAPNGGADISNTIIVDDRIEWTINQLGAGQTATGRFNGRVSCVASGQSFVNFAIVEYTTGGNPGQIQVSDLVNTQVETDLSTNAIGQPTVSPAPTFCSQDTGGFYDMDWGDYDADGDLDALLLSGNQTVGVVVYRNDGNGQFTRLSIFTFSRLRSARWGDFNNDGRLDILVVGYWDGAGTSGPTGGYFYAGYNYIFLNTGGDSFQLDQYNPANVDSGGRPYTFQSNDGMSRAAVADYDDDGRVDIVLGNEYAITNGCGVQLDRNNNGQFVANLPNTSAWAGSNLKCLLTEVSVGGLAWGDYDNNGLLDLAVGILNDPNAGTPQTRVTIFRQTTPNNFTLAVSIPFSVTSTFSCFFSLSSFTDLCPYDVRWGDYNGDGFLDLAVALGSEVRIYRNNSGASFSPTITLNSSNGLQSGDVRAIDWLDFDGDGKLELAVADRPTQKIYEFNPVSFTGMPENDSGNIYSIRGVDATGDGNLDLAVINFNEKAFVFTVNAPFLSQQPVVLNNSTGSGTVWGDASTGGLNDRNDLLFGISSSPGNTLYFNSGGQLPAAGAFNFVIPSNNVAFGDLESDGDLDIAAALNGSNFIYRSNGGTFNAAFNWRSTLQLNSRSLVFGDFDQDNAGNQELIVANSNAANTFYLNDGLLTSQSAPAWQSAELDDSQSIAWGYLDDDILPDFAVGNYGQVNRVYHNNGDGTFSRVNWNPTVTNDPTRSVAWGDYDGDGDMDLAVGNYGLANFVYENQGGTLSNTPAWTSVQNFKTTAVAWGDWDNDGDLDLAVGNDGQADQVYANFGTTPGHDRLLWLWRSSSSLKTQDIAWGDVDGDGDLDLAYAAQGSNGYYENNYVLPAHLSVNNVPLPFDSTYVSIPRPTPATGQIWYRNTLSDPLSLVIPVNFTVYDPDGTNQSGSRDNPTAIAGNNAATATFEYSVNGGGSWQSATGSWTPAVNNVFSWQAGQDLNSTENAANDAVKFRVTVVHKNKNGLIQRASTSALSPPFRVRNLACRWPEEATITQMPVVSVTTNNVVTFTGSAVGGGNEQFGQMFFNWEFGDGSTDQGQIVFHTFDFDAVGPKVVTLTVTGVPCPVTRPDIVTKSLTVILDNANAIYLPLIVKSGGGGATSIDKPEIVAGQIRQNRNLTRVTDLIGQIKAEGTVLQWKPAASAGPLLGYRIYRSPAAVAGFRLLAEVSANTTTYTDDNTRCGQMYIVMAYNDEGESPPSANSYFSPPCQ